MILNQIVVAAATLLAALGGYVLAGINERKRDERTLRRELDLRAAERLAQQDEDFHRLQRQTLLDLQEALQIMARLTGKALFFDHMQARQQKYTQLPPELNEELHSNGVEVNLLASRVVDVSVRDAVNEFTLLSAHLSMSPRSLKGLSDDHLEARAMERSMQLNEGYVAVSSLLGIRIREEISWRPVAQIPPQPTCTTRS